MTATRVAATNTPLATNSATRTTTARPHRDRTHHTGEAHRDGDCTTTRQRRRGAPRRHAPPRRGWRTAAPARPRRLPRRPPWRRRIQFTDVPATNPFYLFIRCLACRQIVSRYADGTFRPGNDVTRGSIEILASAAGLTNAIPSTQQTFTDVPNSNPFWLFIERLAATGAISGYDCGGASGACDPPEPPVFPLDGQRHPRPDQQDHRGDGGLERARPQHATDVRGCAIDQSLLVVDRGRKPRARLSAATTAAGRASRATRDQLLPAGAPTPPAARPAKSRPTPSFLTARPHSAREIINGVNSFAEE